ncbi:MAG: hypothetical protein Q7V10_05005 [Methanobacteriaceae archaeon]|nr:hypothetical protein [Methanobacteriaceae archaeon]MDO9627645.1 hypothetical protein [Methanobacteriaceae archaeon]
MEKSFEIKKICTNLRPGKVAVLVHKGHGWQEKCLEIIEVFSEIWGGQKNFIVPTDGKTILEEFWILLEKFDPDYICIYNTKNGTINKISDELKEELLKRLNPFFDRTDNDPIMNYFFNSSWPLTFLPDIIPFAENLKSETIYNPIINLPIAECPNYMKLLVHSVLGKISDDYTKKIEEIDIKIQDNDFSEKNLHDYLKWVWNEEPKTDYPFYYSMLKLESYHKISDSDKIRKAPVITVIGDSINDFCLYYNLSSLRKDVFWAPFSLIKDSLIARKKNNHAGKHLGLKMTSFNSYLSWELEKRINHGHSDKKIVFTSISKSKHKIKKLIESIHSLKTIEKSVSISKNVKSLLPYIQRVLEYDNESNCYMEQFIDSKNMNPIKTPLPRNFNHRSFDKHYWITEFNIENYKLPPLSNLSDSIESRLYSNNEIRISENGIAYFCPFTATFGERIEKYVAKPYIKLLSAFEIFKKVFDDLEYIVITSDKGNYERESTEKFGSLVKLTKFLKEEKYQILFNTFIEKKNPESPEDGIFLKDDCRMYLSSKSIRNIIGDEVDQIINDFIKKDILHRGFIFKCEKCKYTGWYDIEDVDIKFKCRRCRKIQYYDSKHLARQNPIEPEWFYKLDESIYQGYSNSMIVPILTLYKLKELSSESFLYTNEIEIRKKELPDNQYREIDICCISDGKIIVGECKIDNKLEDVEIEKYKEIYQEIGADKIIFSTFDEKGWSEGTIKKFEKILGNEVKFEVFNKKDLIS